MLPALQPSRPKPSQQSARVTSVHLPKRAVHENPQALQHTGPHGTVKSPNNLRPQSQIEAMPPFGPGPAIGHAPVFTPPRSFYDSAVRHPVFFTEQLRKPPFPIPEMASHGWSPVASGYILEQRKADSNGIPKTKL